MVVVLYLMVRLISYAFFQRISNNKHDRKDRKYSKNTCIPSRVERAFTPGMAYFGMGAVTTGMKSSFFRKAIVSLVAFSSPSGFCDTNGKNNANQSYNER